jgi:hypothetical protein
MVPAKAWTGISREKLTTRTKKERGLRIEAMGKPPKNVGLIAPGTIAGFHTNREKFQ